MTDLICYIEDQSNKFCKVVFLLQFSDVSGRNLM